MEGGEGEGEVAHDREILWRGWGGAAYRRLGGLRVGTGMVDTGEEGSADAPGEVEEYTKSIAKLVHERAEGISEGRVGQEEGGKVNGVESSVGRGECGRGHGGVNGGRHGEGEGGEGEGAEETKWR